MVLVDGIVHAYAVIVRTRTVGVFRSRNLMENILFVIGLVDVIANVASCIVILLGKENIQCSLVDVEVEVLIV